MNKEELLNMSITQIKSKIEELENNLNYLLEKKQQAFSMTQPKASQLKEVRVVGGTRENLYDKYVIKNEKLDPAINFVQEEIKLLEDYLNRELERINKYDEWEQKVIYLKEEGKTWLYIACNTPFSIRTCQRIYKRYTGKREIKKD
jgi:cell division protein FtsB